MDDSAIDVFLEYLKKTMPKPGSLYVICSNNNKKTHKPTEIANPCPYAANFPCKCGLVSYCSEKCKRKHRMFHKPACEVIPDFSKGWNPLKHIEATEYPYGDKDRSIWGVDPAIDVLNLKDNEGLDYNEDLNLFFTKSGDLRSMVATIAKIPLTYSGRLGIVAHEYNAELVGVNLIILIYIMSSRADPIKETAEHIMHFWYSAFMKKEHFDKIASRVKPSLAGVKADIEAMRDNGVRAFCISHKGIVINAVAESSTWKFVLDVFWPSQPMDYLKADHARNLVIHSQHGLNFMSAKLLTVPLTMRLPEYRHRMNGVLTPYGKTRKGYNYPNPYLFKLMPDGSHDYQPRAAQSPMDGWCIKEVLESGKEFQVPCNDHIGALCYHIQSQLMNAIKVMHSIKIDIRLFRSGMVPFRFPFIKVFDRVHLGDIANERLLGPKIGLKMFARFLKPASKSPYATLISVHLSEAEETYKKAPEHEIVQADLMNKVSRSGGPSLNMKGANHEEIGKQFLTTAMATRLVFDARKYFARWEKNVKLLEASQEAELKKKGNHTIVAPWKYRLPPSDGPAAARREFEQLFMTSFCGAERYIEWVHVPKDPQDGKRPNMEMHVFGRGN